MIFPSIDYSGSGANSIDIGVLEDKAITLLEVGPHLLHDDLEGYLMLLNDLRETAANKLGNIVCGISAFFCYGTDSVIATNLEKIDNYGASFIGEYCGIVAIEDIEVLPETSRSEQHELVVPAAIFSPIDRDDLPSFLLDEYSGVVGELYPFAAVPLVGVPILIERLPLSIDDDL